MNLSTSLAPPAALFQNPLNAFDAPVYANWNNLTDAQKRAATLAYVNDPVNLNTGEWTYTDAGPVRFEYRPKPPPTPGGGAPPVPSLDPTAATYRRPAIPLDAPISPALIDFAEPPLAPPSIEPTAAIYSLIGNVSPAIASMIPPAALAPVVTVANVKITPLLLLTAYTAWRILR